MPAFPAKEHHVGLYLQHQQADTVGSRGGMQFLGMGALHSRLNFPIILPLCQSHPRGSSEIIG